MVYQYRIPFSHLKACLWRLANYMGQDKIYWNGKGTKLYTWNLWKHKIQNFNSDYFWMNILFLFILWFVKSMMYCYYLRSQIINVEICSVFPGRVSWSRQFERWDECSWELRVCGFTLRSPVWTEDNPDKFFDLQSPHF